VGMDVQVHVFFTFALVGGEWSSSRPAALPPGERARGTHCVGGWVDPTTGLNDMKELKILDTTGTRTLTPQSSRP
jgi:hypothetical protein